MSFLHKIGNPEEWQAFKEGYESVKEKVHDSFLELFREAGEDAAESGEDINEAFDDHIRALD